MASLFHFTWFCILTSSSGVSPSCSNQFIDSVSVDDVTIMVKFSDGFSTAYHHVWLRDNSPDAYDVITGQRTRSSSELSLDIKPQKWTLENKTGCCSAGLEVEWPDSTVARFSAEYLYEHAYDKAKLRKRDDLIRPPIVSNFDEHDFPGYNFSALVESEEILHKWLSDISKFGWSVVHGLPDEDGQVMKLAELIAPLSHTTLYGDYFVVKAKEDISNVAYTSRAIGPHTDLPYYESPPGLQMLHCRRSDAPGGDSTLHDAHAFAEVLKQRDPVAFAHLARIPATFRKQRKSDKPDAKAASMEYRRPHIEVTASGEVRGVMWSPPFMGPLRAPPEDVLPYYQSVKAFEELLSNDPNKLKIQLKLKPGSALTFNNRRMLHGRESFEQRKDAHAKMRGDRHLEGAYVNIDDFKSKLQLLNAKFGGVAHRVGNGDH